MVPMGRARRRVRAATSVTAAIMATTLTGGCTAEPAGTPPPESGSVPLRITTVTGGGAISQDDRVEAEAAVADLLTDYVVAGFLGDYPRVGFVQSFEAFTSGLTPKAARDVEQLTASRFGDAESVRATRLDARLSFLARDGDVLGATASVDFAFEARVEGEQRSLGVDGRLMLVEEDGVWRVFGYDVATDDGSPVNGGTS
jgi:hypothetical protein